MRIKRSYESSVCSEIIRSVWEATGFHLNLFQGEVTSFTFDEEFKSWVRHQVSHQVDQLITIKNDFFLIFIQDILF